jgi:GMP synthase (glutamine-hydrolysing)
MKTAIAIRHVHFEDLGSLAPALERSGYEIRYADCGVDDIASLDPVAPDLVVVLGGPIGAYEDDLYPSLKHELKLLEMRLRANRPTIGICLGAQLMARALGARVYPTGLKEIGWARLSSVPRDASRRFAT